MVEPKKQSVQEQLAHYRSRKKKEEAYAALKQRVWRYVASVFTFRNGGGGGGGGEDDGSVETVTSPGTPEESHHDGRSHPALHNTGTLRRRRMGSDREDMTIEEEEPLPTPYTTLDWATLILKILLWLLLQKVFILLEFGAVFFILSAFLFIWYNLRNEPKKKGEVSAYSVFNPNCEVIDGTFTAEQFERELLHKM